MYSDADTLAGGFPHSEMSGSKGALASPDLIAECHVLHRLVSPRHPPDALFALKNPHTQMSAKHLYGANARCSNCQILLLRQNPRSNF
jgi:hypothetical protein